MFHSFLYLLIISLSLATLILIYRGLEIYRGREFAVLQTIRIKTEPLLRQLYVRLGEFVFNLQNRLIFVTKHYLFYPILRISRQILHRTADFLTATLDYLYRRFIHWRYSRLRAKKERKGVE